MAKVALSLSNRLARFASYECTAAVSNREREAILKLVKAGKLFDQIYLRQAWAGNEELQRTLAKDGSSEEKTLFHIYKGPWAREDDNAPFIQGVPKRPDGANFYPEDMSKEEFEDWVKTLGPEEKQKATDFYTVIRRGEHGLKAVPYSEEYKDLLEPAAALMRSAADDLSQVEFALDNKGKGVRINQFLRSRADALLSNDYLPSELDWLRLDKNNRLEVTVGPYEVYTDVLMQHKSAFEFYIHVRDEASSVLLEKFSDLQFVEDRLPVEPKYRNPELTPAPIVVVNQLYASGDVAVPMTAAYNLPNDERAIKEGGSKLVLIKNVQEGKFEKVLVPIAQQVLDDGQLKYVTSDAFTTHILLHEVCHSNGPHYTLDKDTVRSKLKEHHSAMEEAKADIAGLFAANMMVEEGVIENVSPCEFWVTFLASAFRSIRFGIQEAHGLGQACQLNYLVEKGGIECNNDKFRINFEKMKQAVSDLTRKIMVLQGDGDKGAVDAFIKKYGVINEETQKALDRIDHAGIPVDIRPSYPIENGI